MLKCKILFVGAHHDDIELGAAGFLMKCHEKNFDIHALIMTDNEDIEHAKMRRDETTASLTSLGVAKENIHFASFIDAQMNLLSDGEAVGTIRNLAQAHNFSEPDIVVTHTSSDSHNDHIVTNGRIQGAFRNTLFMFYSIHLSYKDSFTPNYFINLDDAMVSQKESALSKHASQADRINREPLEIHEKHLADLSSGSGCTRTEAFEIIGQNAKPECLQEILGLCNSPFHKLWLPIIDDRKLIVLLHSKLRANRDDVAAYNFEEQGRRTLRESFEKHIIRTQRNNNNIILRETSSHDDASEKYFLNNPPPAILVFIGGAVCNDFSLRFYNHFDNEWQVDYKITDSTNSFLMKRGTRARTKYFPEYNENSGELKLDYGIIALQKNPLNSLPIVYAAGCTGRSTQRALELLSSPNKFKPFHDFAWNVEERVEFPFQYNLETNAVKLLK